ncbi:CBS domain-containing protein [Imbroritus primus]|uniref:CBS domain-containing protein n=1 Tax=Imbroritus primus TaxID=3058603 RepID=UPI003D1618EC
MKQQPHASSNSRTTNTTGATPHILRDVMSSKPAYLSTDESIQRAAQLMQQLDVGSLPVCDGRRLTGIVTDRDITVRCTAAGHDPAKTRVGDAMSSDPLWCTEDDAIEDACRKMAEHQVRRIPVVDRDHQLVGMVSLGDLAVKSDDAQGTSEALKDISQPSQGIH